jgi:hypothetical protein
MGPLQRPLPDNTQHSQETDIHASGEIRTRDLSQRAAATYALDHAATGIGPYKFTFLYLGNKEICCIFETCCVISVLFPNKCRLFHNLFS